MPAKNVTDSGRIKVRRGRPVKEYYRPLARNLLWMIEDMRTQRRESPWPGGAASDPSKANPGPFDEISQKARALTPFQPNSTTSFAEWWDYTLELLLVIARNPTGDQWSDRAALI